VVKDISRSNLWCGGAGSHRLPTLGRYLNEPGDVTLQFLYDGRPIGFNFNQNGRGFRPLLPRFLDGFLGTGMSSPARR
jgi:hypothetical protein